MPSQELRQLIKDKVEPVLSQLQGVASVRTLGGDTREIRVDVSLDSAKAAGVAPAQIAERIGMENVDVPAGRFDLGPTELTVRSIGQFENVDEIAAAMREAVIERDKAPGHKSWGMYEVSLNGPDDLLVRVGWPSRLVSR